MNAVTAVIRKHSTLRCQPQPSRDAKGVELFKERELINLTVDGRLLITMQCSGAGWIGQGLKMYCRQTEVLVYKIYVLMPVYNRFPAPSVVVSFWYEVLYCKNALKTVNDYNYHAYF